MLRFGSELIFYFCDLFKVNVIIENKENKSFEETLSHDVIELMTNIIVNFIIAKLYGKRSHKNKVKNI